MPGERTEQATPHRREQAQREGDILHSRELTAAAGALAGVLTLGFVGETVLIAWRRTLAAFLDLGAPIHWEPATQEPTLAALRRLCWTTVGPLLGVFAAVAAGAFVTAILQTGGLTFHGGAVGFKLNRINPASNLKNLFSLRAGARMAKSLIPAGLLALLAIQRIGRQLSLPPFSVARLELLGSDTFGLLRSAAWLAFAWSAIDYLVEWRSREARLRMSREEMREENKQTEGNPQIRGRIRNLQRQARRRRVKADVSKAAVVFTNPTHYAVALAFDFATMEAPRLVAKGRNLLAEEIKDEARWAGVPIVENPHLARSLYRGVEVGQAIPVDLYAAVAAILAYLYRQRVEAELRERRSRETAARARTHADAGAQAAHAASAPPPVSPSAAGSSATNPQRRADSAPITGLAMDGDLSRPSSTETSSGENSSREDSVGTDAAGGDSIDNPADPGADPSAAASDEDQPPDGEA